MSNTRSTLIHKAASLPVGHPERKDLLKKLAAVNYHGDPNVSLESIIYTAQKVFCEDVAKAVLRYSSLKTPVEGKSGATFMRGGVARGGLINREGGEWDLGVEVRTARGKIQVVLSSDTHGSKTFKFPTHETPASIGSAVSWVGTAYLMGETL